MGPRSSLAIAAALIIFPVVALIGYKHWLDTRILVPLDVPVSLSPGHIRTGDFYVNLTGQYAVDVTVDYPYTFRADCPLYGDGSVLRSHLKLFRSGIKIGEADGVQYFYLAQLNADKKGLYRLDVDVLSDASCLNAGHPRLGVSSTGYGFYTELYETAVWLVAIPVLAGLGLFAYAAVIALQNRAQEAHMVLGSDTSRTPVGLAPLKLPRAKPISALPHFGLFCATVLAFVVFAMIVGTIPLTPKGIHVSLQVEQTAPADPDSLAPPIVVRIQPTAKPPFIPRLYVNSTEVEWDGLRKALKDQLSLRPKWLVYIDADSDLSWQYAMDVVDTATELHARVVLLTPKTRKLVEPETEKGMQD